MLGIATSGFNCDCIFWIAETCLKLFTMNQLWVQVSKLFFEFWIACCPIIPSVFASTSLLVSYFHCSLRYKNVFFFSLIANNSLPHVSNPFRSPFPANAEATHAFLDLNKVAVSQVSFQRFYVFKDGRFWSLIDSVTNSNVVASTACLYVFYTRLFHDCFLLAYCYLI